LHTQACAELPLDERLRGAINTTKMPYNIAYVAMSDVRFTVDRGADTHRMISDFFYPQPGGVESHIYQLSSVCDTDLDTFFSRLKYCGHVS
jgi:hypothetical protein